MRPAERRAVCRRARDGCAPLFVACKRGNVEIVEYLIHVCDAELEQRGVYEVPDDRSVHTVTPLWCAAVAGRLEVTASSNIQGSVSRLFSENVKFICVINAF